MNMNEWKKAALKKLQIIEGHDSVYKHQKIISEEERPSIFYTMPEKRLTMSEVIGLVERDLYPALPDSDFSKMIEQRVLRLLKKSVSKINSISSLFVAIETDWGTIDPQFSRKKFYDHYHPPRGNNSEISTLSYFEALHIEHKVEESLNYCNLAKLNLAGKNYKYWRENNPADISKDFQNLSKQTKPEDWKTLVFPETGALEIVFDSFLNLHNISHLSGNLFLTIVINDVDLVEKLSPGEMKFTYLKPNEI